MALHSISADGFSPNARTRLGQYRRTMGADALLLLPFSSLRPTERRRAVRRARAYGRCLARDAYDEFHAAGLRTMPLDGLLTYVIETWWRLERFFTWFSDAPPFAMRDYQRWVKATRGDRPRGDPRAEAFCEAWNAVIAEIEAEGRKSPSSGSRSAASSARLRGDGLGVPLP